MEVKYERILKHCEKEVDRIIKMYKKQKDDPPVPRMFPPIAGRLYNYFSFFVLINFSKTFLVIIPLPTPSHSILGRIKWARSLVSHLDELLSNVTTHHILKYMPATVELSKRHRLADNMLKSFEADMVALWMNQHVRIFSFLRQICTERKLY